MSAYHKNQDYSDEDDDQPNEYDLSADEPSDERIQALSNLSNSDFLNTVKDSSHFLTEEDAPSYFKIVLGHFKDTNLKEEYGKEILISIRKLIRKNDIYNVFKEKKVIRKLPFIYKAYNDEVYAIVYDIVNKDPSILDETFCDEDHFINSVEEDPKKALSIIGNFANKVVDDPESYPSPWPLLQILFTQANVFIVPNLVECYVAILCHLCKDCDDFSNIHIDDCWNTLTKHTSKTNIECHNSIYLGLINLLDANSEKEFKLTVPLEALKNDLGQKITQNAALEFIYSFSQSDESNANKLNNRELLEALFNIENEDAKHASVLLMTLANKNQKLAEQILNCDGGMWMLMPHPDASYTLRLFLTIFSYESLRNRITEMKQFVPFLNFCLEKLSSPGIITVVTGIVRRVRIDGALISRFIEGDFIQNYIKEVNEHQDETNISSHSLLLMINALSKSDINYGDQFLDVIPTIKKLLDDENLSEIASYAAADLSKNESCLDKMVELKVHHFFKTHLKDPKSKTLRHNARRFFRNMKKVKDD